MENKFLDNQKSIMKLYYQKEDIEQRVEELYGKDITVLTISNKILVKCNKCGEEWKSTFKNLLVFKNSCYLCTKDKSYSVDELKILHYIKENYLGNCNLYHADNQKVIRFKDVVYTVDGYTEETFIYDKETKTLFKREGGMGTVFEVLGDYFHSNPEIYNPGDPSPKLGLTHRQNYEYTMKRLKNIRLLGYEVFYIWISDFRKYDKTIATDHLFDYMNIKKCLPKETFRIFRSDKVRSL